jgi:hypothetical protein
MSASKASASVPAHGINFVDKNDARRMFFPLDEKVSDTGSSYAYKHFDKI